MVISDAQAYVRSRTVVARVVAGETLIVPVRGKVGDLASIYSFNETGSLIWKMLDRPRAFSDLVSGVAEAYEVDAERVRADVMRFLNEMRAVGLLEDSAVQISAAESWALENCVSENFLAEVPGTAAGTEGPVGREGLAAADAR
ncbi:MAG TPA: PqqD family protein [Candidatus Sulfotelmatobacter sp.]